LKELYVAQIKERDQVNGQFLVREKTTAMAKNGKPYMTLKLMDRTGEVEGRVWDRVEELSGLFDKDDFVRVAGKASVYLGRMQLVVQRLEKMAEKDVDLGDYLPVSRRTVEEMLAELRQLVAGLEAPHYRQLMEAFLADEQFLQHFVQAPAAKSIHHAYLGGLLEHSLAVAQLADDISRRYLGVQRDLLLTGALLHDIGKVAELCYERSFGYTDTGKLLGHIVIGVEMVEAKLRELENFPVPAGLLLKHLLLSHHGQYEYGSPKRPKTLEAVILNYLDDLDSKINGVQSHLEKEPDNDAAWSGYHRIYDRYFFKETGAQPVPAAEVPPAAQPVTPPVAEGNPSQGRRPSTSKDRDLSFSLADQLKEKTLNLFAQLDEGDN
jgi:3'-5' exoribonuclease